MISVYLLLDYPPFKAFVFPLLALSFFTRFYPISFLAFYPFPILFFTFLLFYLFTFKKGQLDFSLFTFHFSLFTLLSSLFT